MDIATLKALGLSIQNIEDRIVEDAVSALLSSTGFDTSLESTETYESEFKDKIQQQIQKSVDDKISAIAAEHIMPRIGEMLDNLTLQKTSEYGEKKGPPLTLKEFISYRSEIYLSEKVNADGESKEETRRDSHYWREDGSRMTVFLKSHIRETMQSAAKLAITDVNKAIAQSMEKAAVEAIKSVQANIKINVSA